MEATKPTRRTANGRLRACDPCKRQKLACDHAEPCKRCRRLRQESRCIYSPPVTSNVVRPRKPVRAPVASSPLTSSPTLLAALQPGARSPDSEGNVGYLGYTSFKAVFEETRDTLHHLGAPSDTQEPVEGDSALKASTRDVLRLPPALLQSLCIRVLRAVPNAKDGFRLFRGSNAYDGWISRCALFMLEGLYETWAAHLTDDRDEEKLVEMAGKICINTMTDAVGDMPNARDWLGQFTGPNLRWEALGVLFNFWLSQPVDESRIFSPEAREPASLCIRIARDLSSTTSIFLRYLYFRRSIGESMHTGDASHSSWRYHGELISETTFHGAHAQPAASKNAPPTVATQCERRLLWSTFIVDKLVVSFTGRPPLLSRRYVSTPVPLDLKDDDLFDFDADLAEVAARTLDSEGWNTEGGPYYSTLIRCRVKLATIADNIFELVLDADLTSYTIATIRDLKAKTKETYKSFPKSIHWNLSDVKNPEVESTTVMYRLFARLDYLKNIFLLDRLLLKRGHCLDRGLVAVSFDIVSMVLLLWTDRERFIEEKMDFEWLVCAPFPVSSLYSCRD